MASGWTHTESPFHPGEQAIQTRLGVRDKMETFGRRVIRDYLPDQHREFYGLLPFLIIGATDAQGHPWTSIVAGPPGFVSSPNPRELHIATQPLYGSPLAEALQVGTEIGILGILPANRRRNRLTGRISAVDTDGFTVSLLQSFGNCPQYIQTRAVDVLPQVHRPQQERQVTQGDRLDAAARALISESDTLFIATAYAPGDDNPALGADASHRGGKPGFVRVEDERTLVFPDFTGNFHFNTVGNILLNPKAGLLFIDFDSGDLLYLTGRASIVWDGPEVDRFRGAERLIRVRIDHWRRVSASLPLRFRFGEYSPTLQQTGTWEDAATTPAIAAAAGPVQVYFAQSGIDAEWRPNGGTLLELAEAAGLSPNFSCRTGNCGTCATLLPCGSVAYAKPPAAHVVTGEVLICCAMPRAAAGRETCGDNIGVVLDL